MITPKHFNNTSSIVSSLSIVSSKQKNLNLFWLGFTIYFLINAFAYTGHVNIKILQAVELLGLILVFTSIISLIQFKFDDPYLKFIYILYCTWLLTIILRGFNFLFDYSYLKEFLFNPYEGMLYFSPLILLFTRNFIFFKKLFDIIVFFGIFYIIYDILFIKDLLNSDRTSETSQGIVEVFSDLSFSSGYILLTYAYHPKKRQLLALAVIVLALLFAIIRARRGLIFMYSNMILISYILYVFRSKMKFLIIFITIFIALLGAVYISGVYRPHESRIFGFLLARGDENTRERVELYFHDDMKTKDWIMGRAIKGEYFCPDVEEHQITNYRQNIETGYEQTILKGGLISLGLFLLIAVPAILKGLFYSKNILSKVAAIWIFMSLINSYPGTVNAFTLQYLLVWISIGICYSKNIRNLPEVALKNSFQNIT
jgi:hypothetical protein